MKTSQYALEGVRILSMAEQYPGPYATLILADLGADVTLVERAPGGDPSRRTAALFESLNRGKRSIALDLKMPAGRDALIRLASTADVLLEGFRPGTMQRLDLGYEALSKANPRLVYLSISGFGQTGPYRDIPGHDLSFQALAGALHQQLREARPRAPWLSLANLAGGLFAAVGALAALRARDTTGRGGYVDVSLLDSLVALMTVNLVPLMNHTGPAYPPPDPAYDLFRTADGRVLALSVWSEDHLWSAVCRAVGMSRVAKLTADERVARRQALNHRLRRIIATRPLDEWVAVFQQANVPFSPVLDLDDVPLDPQVQAREMVVTVEADERHAARSFIRQPVQIAGYASGPRRHAPAVGEHTAQVLRDAGYSPSEIGQLLESGAAYTADVSNHAS